MGDEKTYSDSKLLKLLQQDSQYGFTLIYNKYKNLIFSVALNLLKSSDLAEEIVQEVFLKLWINQKQLFDVKDLKNYIFIIARNLIFDSLKKTAKEAVLKQEATLATSIKEEKTDFRIREQQINEILSKITELLPPQQKLVFNLVKGKGLSHEKAAEQLQISPLTVKKHMSQALKFIRLHMNSHLTLVIVFLLFRQ